jgi:hypothetical protein
VAAHRRVLGWRPPFGWRRKVKGVVVRIASEDSLLVARLQSWGECEGY